MVTLVIIVVTCLVSILCFTGTLNGNRLLFPLVCRPDIFHHFLAQLGL